MNSPKNERRRGRSQATSGRGRGHGPSGPVRTDPLADLRYALQSRDPSAFAGFFTASGWVRIPRPDGDVVFQGPVEIAQAGHDLAEMFGEFSWTPSQRFLAAGQVVEEAVVRARKAFDTADEEIRVSARAVTALDPSGAVGSLTLWIDWAALNDPLGVASARGAASALVASARAQDARGLRVIQSGPQTSALPIQSPAPPPPAPPPLNRMRPPSAGARWWQRHRRTIAGWVMTLLTVALLGWVAQTVRHSPSNHQAGGSSAGPTTDPGAGSTAGAGAGGRPRAGSTAASTVPTTRLPVIEKQKPAAKPTVQPGPQFRVQSDVLFETGSPKLSASTRKTLKLAAAEVRSRNLTGIIQINGYTDAVGRTATNLTLSRQRATAVAEALQSYLGGVQHVRLLPQAFGEANPVADNATAAGRQLNRRVIIVLPND